MKRAITIMILLSVSPLGCIPKMDESTWIGAETGVHQLFVKDCQGLVVPDVATIKSANVSRSYPYATFDQVWDAAVIVLMQESIIVRAERSQQSGLLAMFTGPPFVSTTVRMPNIGLQKFVQNVTYARPQLVALLEGGTEDVTVYLYWMQGLYENQTGPKMMVVEFPKDRLENESKVLFDKLATQIYTRQKWKYLYAGGTGK